eukprot:550683-Amphidinium_carterae.1
MTHGMMYSCHRNFLMHRQKISHFLSWTEMYQMISQWSHLTLLQQIIQDSFTIPKIKRDSLNYAFNVSKTQYTGIRAIVDHPGRLALPAALVPSSVEEDYG